MTDRGKAVGQIAAVARRYQLDYTSFIDVCKEVRKELELIRPRRSRRLPKLLTAEQLKAYYEAVDRGSNLKHQIMLRLLYYTAIRVSELCHIKTEDVDIAQCKVFIESGKGDKDRYVLFAESFKLALQAHMKTQPRALYLFESRHRKAYSNRGVEKMISRYANEAGIDGVHPHKFRHQMLTWLTSQGLSDAQIQLVSGHSSKKSLEVYQHLSLEGVREGYQDAVRKVEI